MTLKDVASFFWTDSTTVLYWNKENWGTFINNTVKEINQPPTAEIWRHVPGQCNPSDLLSRGCTLKTLLDSRWNTGCIIKSTTNDFGFWAAETVQSVINQCIRCKIYSSKKIKTVPAPLPEDRVRDALVLEVTSVDLAGPLYLKNGNKAWISTVYMRGLPCLPLRTDTKSLDQWILVRVEKIHSKKRLAEENI
ncbi:DUF5641 domain-containing protein [Trichonephila clavipes]|nr:DUF5641 domain-containing protein [Trichonephila clavipes]